MNSVTDNRIFSPFNPGENLCLMYSCFDYKLVKMFLDIDCAGGNAMEPSTIENTKTDH